MVHVQENTPRFTNGRILNSTIIKNINLNTLKALIKGEVWLVVNGKECNITNVFGWLFFDWNGKAYLLMESSLKTIYHSPNQFVSKPFSYLCKNSCIIKILGMGLLKEKNLSLWDNHKKHYGINELTLISRPLNRFLRILPLSQTK